MPIFGASAPYSPITAADVNRRVAKPKPGFNDPGGWGDKLDDIAAAFMDAGGNSDGANSILNRRRQRDLDAQQSVQDRLEARYRQAQIDHLNDPEGVNLGNGGYGMFDRASGNLSVIREPTAQPSENERLMARWRSLPLGDPERDLIERTLRGYQYTQPVMERQQAARLAARQTPTYRDLHPRAGSGRAAPQPPAGFILD